MAVTAPAAWLGKHEFLRVLDVSVGNDQQRATVALHVTLRKADAFDVLLIDGLSAYRAEGACASELRAP